MIFFVLACWAALGWFFLFKYMPETCHDPIFIQPKKIIKQYWRVLNNLNFLTPITVLSLLLAVMIGRRPFFDHGYFSLFCNSFGVMQGFVFGSFIFGKHFVSHFVEKVPLEKITKLSILLAVLGGI